MKYLVVARHGDYNEDTGRLTPKGISKLEQLGDSINQLSGNAVFELVSSPSPRAVESSNILQRKIRTLGVLRQEAYLDNGKLGTRGRSKRNDIIMDIINKTDPKVDGLILMVHEDSADMIPMVYLRSVFDKNDEYVKCVGEGCANFIDEKGHVHIIPT